VIEDACKGYGFSYTIIPLEMVYDVCPKLVDLKLPTKEQKAKFLEEKKNDFDNHTT